MNRSTVQGETSDRCAPTKLQHASVYYDGSCPICNREIAFYQRKADANQIAFIDASACAVSLLGNDLDRDQALARLHVRRADGALVNGAAAFAEIWTSVPSFRWLGYAAKFRPVTTVLDFGYRVVLKIRPRLQSWFR